MAARDRTESMRELDAIDPNQIRTPAGSTKRVNILYTIRARAMLRDLGPMVRMVLLR